MPTNRVPLRRRLRGQLSFDQEQALWLGCGRGGSFPFESEAEAFDLWQRHKPRLMAEHAQNGHRPYAWWLYESEQLGLTWPGYDNEQSYLYEYGELSETEVETLTAFWREQFDRCHEPGFAHCEGPGKWLRGREAREAHLQWADVPRSLVEKWSAERRATA